MYSPSTLDGVGNFSVHATKKKKILQLQLKENKNLLRRDEIKSMKENCSFRVLMPGKMPIWNNKTRIQRQRQQDNPNALT